MRALGQTAEWGEGGGDSGGRVRAERRLSGRGPRWRAAAAAQACAQASTRSRRLDQGLLRVSWRDGSGVLSGSPPGGAQFHRVPSPCASLRGVRAVLAHHKRLNGPKLNPQSPAAVPPPNPAHALPSLPCPPSSQSRAGLADALRPCKPHPLSVNTKSPSQTARARAPSHARWCQSDGAGLLSFRITTCAVGRGPCMSSVLVRAVA